MTTYEIVEKIIKYYSNPDNAFGWDKKEKRCMYFSPEGNRCAIGCLIPNPKQFQELSLGRTITEILTNSENEGRSIAILLLPEDLTKEQGIRFLQTLQTSHDAIADRTTFEEKSKIDALKGQIKRRLFREGFEDTISLLEKGSIL